MRASLLLVGWCHAP